MPVKFDLDATLASGHSKLICDRIVAWVGGDKKRFAELMTIFFAGEYRLTQRAAWPMSYCVRHHPELITPYWRKIVAWLKNDQAHPAVIRNILRLLQDVQIPSPQQGAVMDLCFGFISSNEVPIAFKAFSLTILQHLGESYPDILPELKAIIEARWNLETPAFRHRARQILNDKNSRHGEH